MKIDYLHWLVSPPVDSVSNAENVLFFFDKYIRNNYCLDLTKDFKQYRKSFYLVELRFPSIFHLLGRKTIKRHICRNALSLISLEQVGRIFISLRQNHSFKE